MPRSDLYETWLDTDKCWFKQNCGLYGTEHCVYNCSQFEQTHYLLCLSNLPKKYTEPQHLDLTVLSQECYPYISKLYKDSIDFVNRGGQVYLYGDAGVGKTSWATQILTNYFANISIQSHFQCRGLFISVPSFLRDAKFYITYKNSNYSELLETLKVCDLVVWDDIMQTNPTDYESQWLYSYINERIQNNLANIYTSNLSPHDLSEVDKRLYSRVCVGSDCIEITNKDMRANHTYFQLMNA